MAIAADRAEAEVLAQAHGADVEDYVALLKPRVMSLVVFTAMVGMATAPTVMHPVVAAIALLAIAAGAGASGALNMWYDADIDGLMLRTRSRPIPAGRMHPGEALGFGVVLAAFAVAILGLAANWLAAGLLAFTIFFYVVVYTMWLKRWTPQNIVIGGAAGALPPVIGWAAASGAVSLEPLLYFLIIFVWTPPHFWALSLLAHRDYERAAIPMLPNVAGEASTRRHIFGYAALLAPVGALPWFLGYAGPAYGVAAILFGAEFLRRAFALRPRRLSDESRAARRLFAFSIVYLFALFAVRLAESALAGLTGG